MNNEIINTDNIISENTTNFNYNDIEINSIENETTENIVIEDTNIVTLETIHNDLGFICSFLIIAAVLIFMKMLYKLFNMFF